MLNLKRMVCMLLTAGMFTTALPVQALAASDYQYITNISLKVEVDLDAGDEVNSGDSVGTSKDDSGTKVYEYRFRSSYGSSKVSISGGEFVSCSKSGSSLKVVLRVNWVKGTYEAPKEAEWGSGKGKATWKAPDDKTGYYDVILYKGSTVMKKLEDYNGTSYNFYPHTDEQKRYGKKSEWTESDSKYIDEDDVSDGSGQDNSSNGSNSGGITPGGGTTDAGWKQDNNDWYFKYPDGNYVKNNWLQWNNKWYLFDNSGKMLKGWQQKDNHWYYFDTTNGGMRTGWVKEGDKWYYLNPNQGGPEGAMISNCWLTISGKTYFINQSGVMMEGWYQISGKWYYFYPGDGSKAVSTSIGGFQVDADGVWNH